MLYCGIDPGKEGGIVLLTNNKILSHSVMRQDYDFISEIEKLVSNMTDIIFVIEKVSSMPGQGVSSTFKFGYNTGYMYGVLHTLKQRVVEVSPLQWKKYYRISGKKQSLKLSNEKTSLEVRQLYPEMIDVKFHSGIYDAILIARYYIEKGLQL